MTRVKTATAQTIMAIQQKLAHEPTETRKRSLLAFDGEHRLISSIRSFKGALIDPLVAHLRIQAMDTIRYLSKYVDENEDSGANP